jgi:4-amino-4-deoxy-L-arabinose transferase-like glycosyltransferase
LADFRDGRIARPETVTLAFVLAVGAVVRALMMLAEPGILSPDSNSFLISAEATLAGDLLTHDPFKTPLYSLYLAAFMRLGANQTSGTLLIASQHVLGLMTTAIFFGIALRLFSLWVAAVSSLMLTIHALLLFYETSILSETLFVFLLALLLDQTIRLVSRRFPLWRFAALGALAGLTTLTRPVAQWFIVIIAAVVMTSERASGRWLRAASLAVGVCVVTLLPWMYVNKQSFGFWGVSLGQGLGLFMRVFDVDKHVPIPGTAYPAVEKAIAATNRGNAYAVRNELNFRLGFSASGSDAQMLGYALANVRAHPLSYVWHSARNWMEQLLIEQEDIEVCRSREGPYLCNSRSTDMATSMFPNVPPPGHRRLKRRLAAWFTQWYVRMWIVVPLAFVGMIYYVVRRSSNTRMPGIVLIAAVLYFSGIPALINWPEERFRLPIDPVIFIFACVGGQALIHLRRAATVTLTSLPRAGR